jgi:CheY-like chemotaxis protein
MFVLLIDDEAALRDVAQAALEDAEMVVIPASDGARALRILERSRPDVIVTDMMMPELDGFGFLERYTKLEDHRAPVVAVSSFEPYLARAEACGAAAVLAKPYTARALVETIRRVVAERKRLVEPTTRSAPPPPSPPPDPASEADRVREIRDLRLDEPAPEQHLHDFVAEVAVQFDVPIALVSVVNDRLQYWVAGVGLAPEEVGTRYAGPREKSFCTHAVAARAALVVQDSLRNPFFRDNPVLKERGLRFYAGVPLLSRHGRAVGTLCLLDKHPRKFTHADLELLSLFANRVLCALERREKERSPEIPDSVFRYLDTYDAELGVFGRAAFQDLAIVQAARAAEERHRLVYVALAVPEKRIAAIAEALSNAWPRTIVGRLDRARLGWLVPRATVAEARQMALDAGGARATAEATQLDRHAGAIPTVLDRVEHALGPAAAM